MRDEPKECLRRRLESSGTGLELYEKVVCFFIYSTFNKITSFPWKLNRYSYGVQFEINCTALDQSKLSNFVECTIIIIIIKITISSLVIGLKMSYFH